MAVQPSTDWHPTAAYLYALHLDGPSLAWEYLRRNPDYRDAWKGYLRRPANADPKLWGLRLFEDPERDARAVQPDWALDPDSLMLLRPDDDPPGDAPPFRLWGIPGRKHLAHDGQRLMLVSNVGGTVLRMALAPALADGMPFTYTLRAGGRLSQRWRAIEAQLAALDAADADQHSRAAERPGRAQLVHMRSLQALDGSQAGASQRDVAEALFGRDEVTLRWHADSELRARVRHLIRRGRTYVSGGYYQLLHTRKHVQGDERKPAESPSAKRLAAHRLSPPGSVSPATAHS